MYAFNYYAWNMKYVKGNDYVTGHWDKRTVFDNNERGTYKMSKSYVLSW